MFLELFNKPAQFHLEFLAERVSQHSPSPKKQATLPNSGLFALVLFASFAAVCHRPSPSLSARRGTFWQ
jgi:hypothetical protein